MQEKIRNRLADTVSRVEAPLDTDGALARRRQSLRGDFWLDPSIAVNPTLMPAAVLVPLVNHSHGMTVLLTQRTAHLNKHAGQISFPGGRIEEEDATAVHTALRETEEEVGVPAQQIEIVGRLDDYVTGTGFVVAPVVGLIEPPVPIEPDPFEVEEVFEVPLDFFLDPTNHQQHTKVFRGVERRFYAMPYEERYIWGATAAMLVNLYELLRD